MLYKKMYRMVFLLATLCLWTPFSVSYGAMSGGTYSIFADTFSTSDDSAESTGGTYSLRSTGGEFGAGILGTTATGTLSVSAPFIFSADETFYLSDGTASRTFKFKNLAGFGNGTLDGDNVVVDFGGGGGATAPGLAIRIRDAINDPDANLTITATALDNVVTVINQTPGSAGNTAILETVANAGFVVTGMSGGGNTYSLRGGFQAMERGATSLVFSTSTINLGALSLVAVASSSVDATISIDASNGYSLTFDEDGNLRSGGNDIDDVADGTVSVGSEEYGIRTSGGGGELVADTAVEDGLEVASSGGPVADEDTNIIFHASIGSMSRAGDYSQTITATLTANP